MKASLILFLFTIGFLQHALGSPREQKNTCGGTCNPYEGDGWCSEECYCEMDFPLPLWGYCTRAEYASIGTDTMDALMDLGELKAEMPKTPKLAGASSNTAKSPKISAPTVRFPKFTAPKMPRLSLPKITLPKVFTRG
uniref:Putative secreted protein n=1 Tax=Amblyomma triste TaxID=251400 RepID=A0A023G4Q9_AMBTT